MSDLSKLGTFLVVVFLLSLVALLGEVFYVLWRRRRFQRQNPSVVNDLEYSGGDPFSIPSKELLYFFCWKTQTRIEPTEATESQTTRVSRDAQPPEDTFDVLKWHGMHGPSRILFTIKEEEREDVESEKSSSLEMMQKKERVSLEECFVSELEVPSPEVAVTVGVDAGTPFSTPCGSPSYFTPTPSPVWEVKSGSGNMTDSPENESSSAGDRLEVHGRPPSGGSGDFVSSVY